MDILAAAEKKPRPRAIVLIFIGIVLLASILIRLPNLTAPLLDSYGFRQTQTAITVQNYLREGLSVLHYQTPVLGEPWTLPMEFPTYQIVAYFFARVLQTLDVTNLDCVMRMVSILFFYLSLIHLFRFSKAYFCSNAYAYSICAVFLFAPFTVFWSRTGMIESCAVYFTLAYVDTFYNYLCSKKPVPAILCVIFGALGYLTKSTSMIPACIFLAFVILQKLVENGGLRIASLKSKSGIKYLGGIGLLALLPTIPGIWWLKYSDTIKANSGYTALTSAALKDWNFGTWAQKTALENWPMIFKRFLSFFPIAILLVLILALPFLWKREKRGTLLAVVSGGTCLVSVFILFNLYYVHDYYFFAISPFVCITVGAMLTGIGQHLIAGDSAKVWYVLVVCCGYLIFGVQSGYYSMMTADYSTNSIVALGQKIQEVTVPEEALLVFDDDWNSEIPYYAERKACMVWSPILQEPFSSYIGKYPVVVAMDDANRLLSNYDKLSQLMPLRLSGTSNGWCIFRKDDRSVPAVDSSATLPVRGSIDIVQESENGMLTVQGWAGIDDIPMDALYCKISDGTLIPAIYGAARGDVPGVYPQIGDHTGFVFQIDPALWQAQSEVTLLLVNDESSVPLTISLG